MKIQPSPARQISPSIMIPESVELPLLSPLHPLTCPGTDRHPIRRASLRSHIPHRNHLPLSSPTQQETQPIVPSTILSPIMKIQPSPARQHQLSSMIPESVAPQLLTPSPPPTTVPVLTAPKPRASFRRNLPDRNHHQHLYRHRRRGQHRYLFLRRDRDR